MMLLGLSWTLPDLAKAIYCIKHLALLGYNLRVREAYWDLTGIDIDIISGGEGIIIVCSMARSVIHGDCKG
jgi:hypothetical protein